MRTLALLSAILLLVLLAQADPLTETVDVEPFQDESGIEDQDVEVSFTEDKRSAQVASDLTRRRTCYCRSGFCRVRENHIGNCGFGNLALKRCCRKDKKSS
ncbi:PREDICTED: neutrophil defensin 4 [Chrysochloris asiatica]|uniref:Neutrophil defensin 4 n=1 Tax=Chrysochloris asiatica TaxID=185453 RepID=A0A9B0WPT5_CHRAS|nr:PREDICTED: neutrophil defensin 4 [Chrysochloris asiatica]